MADTISRHIFSRLITCRTYAVRCNGTPMFVRAGSPVTCLAEHMSMKIAREIFTINLFCASVAIALQSKQSTWNHFSSDVEMRTTHTTDYTTSTRATHLSSGEEIVCLRATSECSDRMRTDEIRAFFAARCRRRLRWLSVAGGIPCILTESRSQVAADWAFAMPAIW